MENVTFPHGLTGIFVSRGAIIGDRCTILQHVTIGSNTMYDSPNAGAPHIGNNVFTGVGACIVGNIHIGDNVRIGANTTVYRDVPSNSTVVSGGGMRIIPSSEDRDNTFHEFVKR